MRITIAILFVACLAGCTSLTRRTDVAGPDLAQTPIEDKHYYEVLDALGPPAQITEMPSGFAFLYESLVVRDRQIGISPNTENLWSLIRLSYGRVSLQHDILMISFDESGMVHAVGRYDEKEPIGSGFVISPIFSVKPSVDTSYLDVPPVQSSWGRASLRRLPQTLNREQDLRSGRSGFQLIGTPVSIGQHSLENQKPRNLKRRDR